MHLIKKQTTGKPSILIAWPIFRGTSLTPAIMDTKLPGIKKKGFIEWSLLRTLFAFQVGSKVPGWKRESN